MRIPHELERSIPREVTLTAAGRVAAVVACRLGVSGIALSVWLYSRSVQARAADLDAVAAPARVVGLSGTRGDHPRWVATYEYRVDEVTHGGRSTLGRRDRQRLAVGDVLQILYLPAEPAKSWVDGYQPGRIPVVLAPLAFVAFGLGAGALAFTLRRQRTMLSLGRPAVATVKDVKKVSNEHGNTYRATVEYQTLGGGRTTRKLDVSKATVAGAELIVLYDPETPARAVKYPLSLVKPAEG